MYKFSVYEFSEKEISQICELVRNYTAGQRAPIDARKIAPQVRKYGLDWGLLEEERSRLYLSKSLPFDVLNSVPVEVLWRLTEPMLSTEHNVTGYSITKNKLWLELNIYPEGHRYANDREFMEKMTVLNRLASHGYIIFQYAGSIWEICRLHNRLPQ